MTLDAGPREDGSDLDFAALKTAALHLNLNQEMRIRHEARVCGYVIDVPPAAKAALLFASLRHG